jgi:Rad3-related DNA helicase
MNSLNLNQLTENLSSDDMGVLNSLLHSKDFKKKMSKLSKTERNKLFGGMNANANTNVEQQQEEITKDFKDMTDDEKKIHREKLKLKLKNKQNQKKSSRTNDFGKKNNIDNTINELSQFLNTAPNLTNSTNNSTNNSMPPVSLDPVEISKPTEEELDNLEDYLK